MKIEEVIEMIDTEQLSVSEINPRTIKDDKFRKLMQSIQKDADFLNARPILVNRVGKKMTIYAGTQRYFACKELGWLKVPCIVDNNIPEDVMKARMLRDNHNNGAWDTESLRENFKIADLDLLDLNVGAKRFVDIFKAVEEVDLSQKAQSATPAEPKVKEVKQDAYNLNITFTSIKTKRRAVELMEALQGDQRFEDVLLARIDHLQL